MAVHTQSVAIKIRTKISDIERVTKGRHTPRLPFETDWKPPNLKGISQLTLKGDKLSVLLGPRLLSATITASLDEPAVLQIAIWDPKPRSFLNSGMLDQKLRFGVGANAFLLTRATKQGDLITLELEDARVNKLRDFTTKKKAERGTSTRVGFVKQLMQEPGVPDLALYIDTGKQGQITIEKNPLAISADATRKPPKPSAFAKTKVKGQQADAEQLDNIKTVLGHLYDLGATKDELIMASMCCTQEASWHNLSGGDRDSVGLFQQRASESAWAGGGRNRKKAAELFWASLKRAEGRFPGLEKTLLISAVQRPDKRYYRAYAAWQAESTATVSAWNQAYGSTQSVATTKYYEFRRGGLDGSIEDTWQCTGRLADEVQYRRFIVDDVFYFLPDELLIGTGPVLALTEKTPGVRSAIDFDMDTLYEPNTCTFDVHGNKWVAPVGTCIELDEVGPANGVWLVNKITGNLFTPDVVSVECVRPRAVLTEPPADQTDIDSGVSQGGRVAETGRATDALDIPASPEATAAILEVQTWLGVKYVYGGNSRSGIDCSGLMQQVYGAQGVSIPRTSQQQFKAFPHGTDRALLQPGDEVFFNWGSENPPGHCGMFVGKGAFIHAPHTGSSVHQTDLESYISSGAKWMGFTRPLNPTARLR